MKKMRKRYCLYDPGTTYFIIVGFSIMYIGALGIPIYIAYSSPEDFLLGALVYLVPAFVVIPILGRNGQFFSRYMIRCRFSSQGIIVYNPIWKRVMIRWEDIHTYGMFNSSYSYASMNLIFISMDGTEPDSVAQRVKVSKERLVFQNRAELWPALSEFMPADMKKHLEESMRTGRACYVRR